MNHEDAWVPTRTQRWTAVAGLLTLVLGAPIALAIFASSTLPWVLGVWVPLGLVLAVGPVVRRINARRFPVTLFGIDDVSGPASQIEDAKSRLAGGTMQLSQSTRSAIPMNRTPADKSGRMPTRSAASRRPLSS